MTDTCNPDRLAQTIAALPGGVLQQGSHCFGEPGCCILEAVAICEGLEKTDNPITLNRPDIRTLNDSAWQSDESRTAQMLRLGPLLAAWPLWKHATRIAFVERVALRIVREIIPIHIRALGYESLAATFEQCGTYDHSRLLVKSHEDLEPCETLHYLFTEPIEDSADAIEAVRQLSTSIRESVDPISHPECERVLTLGVTIMVQETAAVQQLVAQGVQQ